MENRVTAVPGLRARLEGQTERQRLIFAALAGVVVSLGLPPVPWTGVLVPVGLAWFFMQLSPAERPARLAWVFGFSHQLTLQHWLFFLIPAKTIPTRALIPAQALAAIGYVALFYLIFGWLYGRARRRLGTEKAFLMLPVLFVGMELLRDRGELAYPWCLSGSCVLSTPLLSLARTQGEMGLGAAVVFTAVAAAAWVLGHVRFRMLTATALGIWLALALGSVVSGPEAGSAPVKVAAVQADVALADKWDKDKLAATVDPYTRLTQEAVAGGAQLVVWAETAIPAYVRYDRELMDWVRDLAREQNIFIYTGFPDAQREADGTVSKFNSSGLFNRQGTLVDRYAKYHLLPIGEAMPFTRYLPFLAKIDVGQAEWAPGAPPQVLKLSDDVGPFPFSGLICFESILGRLARDSVRQGSGCLIVLTNDGWFGKTAGPMQHAALARMRAAECGVPLIRCANNGISLITDERGRVLDSLPLGRAGVVEAELKAGAGGTLFVRFGNTPLVLFLLGWTLLILMLPGNRSHAHST
jgi:apolipoprotein N-acyltransferase